MGDFLTPLPAKLFIALTYYNTEIYSDCLSSLKENFGTVEETFNYSFSDFTDHYEDEIGKPLSKTILSFENLMPKDECPELKHYTNDIERKFADENQFPIKRKINVDPGYLTEAKVVLLTTKNFSHRVYINTGVFGEVTLNYRKETFSPNTWTYPDYASTKMIRFFNKIRENYRNQLAQLSDIE